MPAKLSSPHRVLSPAKIEKGTRRRDYESSLEWLCDAMLLNRCRCNPDPDLALELNEDPRRVKCYFLDTGLLISFAFGKESNVVEDVYNQLLDGKLSIDQGMFFENAVAQQLVSMGRDLWFTEFGENNSGNKYEVDFLLFIASKWFRSRSNHLDLQFIIPWMHYWKNIPLVSGRHMWYMRGISGLMAG